MFCFRTTNKSAVVRGKDNEKYSCFVGLPNNNQSFLSQGGRGQWAVYYSSPQSFKITFSYLLGKNNFGYF